MIIKILGLDPSLSNFGIVSVDFNLLTNEIVKVNKIRLVETSTTKEKNVRKNSDDLNRAVQLVSALLEESKDHHIAIAEVPVGSQSARAMASYGVCIGVLAGCPIPMIQVKPDEVKIAACGNKTASKSDMISWASLKHPEANWLTVKRNGVPTLTNKNEHPADALAAVYAGIRTDQFLQATSLMKAMSA